MTRQSPCIECIHGSSNLKAMIRVDVESICRAWGMEPIGFVDMLDRAWGMEPIGFVDMLDTGSPESDVLLDTCTSFTTYRCLRCQREN